jgi:uncharacterized caspase-like protein
MKKIALLSFIFMTLYYTNSYAYGNTYAVIVGVADYEIGSKNDLTYTINDAHKMVHFLMSKEGGRVPAKNIYLMTNEKANHDDILKYTKKLFSKAVQGDRVLFYFSGHGMKGAFVPYDIRSNGSNLLYFSELKEAFRSAKCNTKLLFADACFAGSLKKNSTKEFELAITKEFKISSIKVPQKEGKQNIAVMLSCKENETSLEQGSLKQGIFTYTLIKGLRGYADRNKNDKITIKELFYYVHDNTKKLASMSNNHKQTPVLFGNFNLNLIVGRVY